MAKAFEEQLQTPEIGALSFEERLGLLVDREATDRDNRRLKSRLKHAALRHPGACIEDIDYRASRHPRSGRLYFRLHEKLIVDIDGGAHRLLPH